MTDKHFKPESPTDPADPVSAPEDHCPLCNEADTFSDVLFSEPRAYAAVGCLAEGTSDPVHTAALLLQQCSRCGIVVNRAFDEPAMQKAYSSNAYVPKTAVSSAMSSYQRKVIEHCGAYLDAHSRVLEIGSGTGALASRLAAIAAEVVTVDPSEASQRYFEQAEIGNRSHINSMFDAAVAARLSDPGFDLICTQQFLEHCPNPGEILTAVNACCKPNGFVYLEVPNAANIIENGRFCDLFHDHFAYFTFETLSGFMGRLGLRCVNEIYFFEGQFLGSVFVKDGASVEMGSDCSVPEPADYSLFRPRIELLNEMLSAVDSIVVWGAGSQGQALQQFLLPRVRARITAYVDKDKNKCGRFAQDTGAPICLPDESAFRDAGVVVISAVLYQDEIHASLRNEFNYRGLIIGLRDGVERLA